MSIYLTLTHAGRREAEPVTRHSPDEVLVAACLRGNAQAERALFDRFAGSMVALCRRYCTDTDEADDLVQTGFIRLFEKLPQYRGGSLAGWVRRVFVTNCLNAWRSRKRQNWLEALPEETENLAPTQPEVFDHLADAQLVDAIATLPEGARVIFNLFAVEGYPHTEIAQMLGITEGGCRAQYARARQLLQQKLAHLKPDYINAPYPKGKNEHRL